MIRKTNRDKYMRQQHYLTLSYHYMKVREEQKLSRSNKQYIRNIKKVHLLALTVAVMLLAMVPIQSVSAASLSIPITATGSKTVSYRDLSSLVQTPVPTVEYDPRSKIITLNDFNADLDVNAADTATVTLDSNPVILTETSSNSKIFQATVLVPNDETTLTYNPDPPESARAEITLDLSSSTGNVVISDVIIDNNEIANMCFRPVTHAVNVALSGGGALGPTNTSVKISWANAIFGVNDNLLTLQMYYKKPTQGWALVTPNFFVAPGAFNFAGKTLSTSPASAGYAQQITTGQFILGFPTGCGGGGGGGLIRPGLVLNLLAGLSVMGGGGPDISAPSLNFGSAPEQNGFGGTLVTEDNNSFPLVINGMGYYLPFFSNTITPVELNTGQNVDLTLTFLEYSGVEHVAMHFVNENNDEISDTDAIITYHKGDVTKVDPEGILGDDIMFSKTKDGNKYSFNFGFSFDEPTNRHLIITAWDENKNSGNTKVFNAFAASGESNPNEVNHMIYLDLGAYFITANGIFASGEKPDAAGQPVIEFDYPDSVGRTERHDGIMYDQIANEKARASQVIADKFNLDTQTFVANDEVKPYDTSRRATELDSPFVGHKLRDYTLSPEENGKLIKELSWKEHLKAQKILDSLLAGIKYQK